MSTQTSQVGTFLGSWTSMALALEGFVCGNVALGSESGYYEGERMGGHWKERSRTDHALQI